MAGRPPPLAPGGGDPARPWVAAYPPGVPPTYALPDVALPRFLDDAARDFPDRAALVVDGRDDHLRRPARPGRPPGDGAWPTRASSPATACCVALPLGEPAPTVLFAVWRLGAVAVPVDPTTRADLLAARRPRRRGRRGVATAGRSRSCGEDAAPPCRGRGARRRVGPAAAAGDRAAAARLPRVRRGRGRRRPTVPTARRAARRRARGADGTGRRAPARRTTRPSSPTARARASCAASSSATPTWSPTPSRAGCGSPTSRPAANACWSPTRCTSPSR